MTGLVKPGSNLPVTDDFMAALGKGIAKASASTVRAGGLPYLKLQKHGVWAYGQNDDPVEDDSEWIVVTPTLQHGWCCWVRQGGDDKKGKLMGEVLAPMTQDIPERPAPIQNNDFVPQWAVQMKCISGTDEGLDVVYKNNSMGGMDAKVLLCNAITDKIAATMQARQKDPAAPAYIYPVIVLKMDSYPNKTYGGVTFTPIFEIIDWFDGSDSFESETVVTKQPAPAKVVKPAPAPAPEPAPEPAPAPVKAATPQRKKAAAQPPQPEPVSAQSVEPPPQHTARAHTGQRRRPVVR